MCHPLESHKSLLYQKIISYNLLWMEILFCSCIFTFKHGITSFVVTILQECLFWILLFFSHYYISVETWYNKFYASSLCTISSTLWQYVTWLTMTQRILFSGFLSFLQTFILFSSIILSDFIVLKVIVDDLKLIFIMNIFREKPRESTLNKGKTLYSWKKCF